MALTRLVGAFYFRYFSCKNLGTLAIDKNRVALHKSFQENKHKRSIKVTSVLRFYCYFMARFLAKQSKVYLNKNGPYL